MFVSTERDVLHLLANKRPPFICSQLLFLQAVQEQPWECTCTCLVVTLYLFTWIWKNYNLVEMLYRHPNKNVNATYGTGLCVMCKCADLHCSEFITLPWCSSTLSAIHPLFRPCWKILFDLTRFLWLQYSLFFLLHPLVLDLIYF